MDRMMTVAIMIAGLVGGFLVTSGLIAHVALVERLGVSSGMQTSAGSALVMIALCTHIAMGGRLWPWAK